MGGKKQNLPFKANPTLAPLFFFLPSIKKRRVGGWRIAEWRGGLGREGSDSGFRQTRCGTALVNKRQDEEDQRHCSLLNTAPEEQKNTGYSAQRLPLHALAHWKHCRKANLSLATGAMLGFSPALPPSVPSSPPPLASLVLCGSSAGKTKEKPSRFSRGPYVLLPSPAIRLCQADN